MVSLLPCKFRWNVCQIFVSDSFRKGYKTMFLFYFGTSSERWLRCSMWDADSGGGRRLSFPHLSGRCKTRTWLQHTYVRFKSHTGMLLFYVYVQFDSRKIFPLHLLVPLNGHTQVHGIGTSTGFVLVPYRREEFTKNLPRRIRRHQLALEKKNW